MSAERKRAERERRKADGQVALSGWLSASDHAALTQMAREAGMTQAQVVSRLIGMRGRIERLEQYDVQMPDVYGLESYIRHSDLTAAVGLGE